VESKNGAVLQGRKIKVELVKRRAPLDARHPKGKRKGQFHKTTRNYTSWKLTLFQALKTISSHTPIVCWHLTAGMLSVHFLSCELSVLSVLVVSVSMYVYIAYGLVDDAEGSGVGGEDVEEGALAAAEPKDKEAKKRKVADSESLQPNVQLSQGAVVERKVTDGSKLHFISSIYYVRVQFVYVYA
jgi:hypothetical protein